MPKISNEFSSEITNYLIEIANGKLSISEEQILAEEDEGLQTILFGLLHLHEDLVYNKAETKKLLNKAEKNASDQIKKASDINELTKEKDIAIKTGELKEEFLANMSHEIRTPMNAIKGLSTLLAKNNDTLSEKQIEYINAISYNSNSLLGIISDILDFSKIEAGKLTLSKYPFNLNDNLSNLVYSLQNSANEKDIQLQLVTSSNFDFFIDSDWVRLNQILTNLISNAIKFTSEGGVKLSVSVLNENANNISINFNIIDTGIGIAEDQQQLIFKPFSQANSTTTRDYGGTGLGLSIVGKLIALFDSEIHIISTVGKGTKMFFNITFNKSKAEKDIVDSDPIKAIIIEEDPFLATVSADIILDLNEDNKVEIVSNQEDVLKHLTIQTFDIIIIDIDFADRILDKSNNEILHLITCPILFLADPDDKVLIDKYKAEGYSNFITKGFSEERIKEFLLSI